MKHFIKYTLLFLLPIILISYPLDIYISSKLKHSHEYQGEVEVWSDVYNGTINSEILVYGSSRAWVGINPQILADTLQTTVYNLGMDGHNFWLQYLRHLEYLKNNKASKQIILAVDFGSLQKREDLYLYEQFLPYMLWNSNIINFTKSYEGFDLFDYYLPLKRYIGEYSALKQAFNVSLENDNNYSYRNLGFRSVNKSWTDEFELARTKMKSYKVNINSASVSLFNMFLANCKDNNIDVVLVYTPEYIEGQKFIENRQKIISIYKLYANKYDFYFLDYSKDNINYDKQYFYNATHLNKSGSNLFSQNLAHDLLELKKTTN
jgi:hypothetical protein